MKQAELEGRVRDEWMPLWNTERDRLDRIDKWVRWDHDKPHQPRNSTQEYKELAARAQTPWLSLVVTSLVQELYVDGYRRADADNDSTAWSIWQANGFDARQVSLHRSAITYGVAYVTVIPGTTFTGETMPVLRAVSPRRMLALYNDPAEDDWPTLAMRCDPLTDGRLRVRVYDDRFIHEMTADEFGGKVELVGSTEHGVGVCPVVRYTNLLDLEGRTDGEVEPYISTAARIDQTTFDRLVVQRFSSWVVRTIAGMSIAETVDSTGETPQAAKLRLKVEDLLVAEDADTKFGSLPASPLDGFILAHESDIRALAAVSQTPAHELLGSLANLSAEALAAARASATAKKEERKITFGESHEQTLRLASWVAGDTVNAGDYEAQVRWRDTEIRSLAQAADALGKLATMLGVPAEMLWEKIPGFTQLDVERAKVLATQEGGLADMLRKLTGGIAPAAPAIGV